MTDFISPDPAGAIRAGRKGAVVLEVRDLSVDFGVDKKWVPAADRPELRGPRRRGAGHRGGVRVRQECQLHGPAGPAAQQQPGLRQRQARRQGTAGSGRGQHPQRPRQGRGGDLPGAHDGAEPGLHGGGADRGNCAPAQRGFAGGSPRTRPAHAGTGRTARTRRRPSGPTRTSFPAASASAR